jgi:8-oxo-dGTP pyrophosphatase MutT (NUDIX family)
MEGGMWIAQLRDLLNHHPLIRLPQAGHVPAAVVVPLSVRDGHLMATLIHRGAKVNHPNQISFPGGQMETADADLYSAALREMEEEIGIPGRLALPIGELSDQITPTGFWIRPFVAAIPAQSVFKTKDVREVVDIFSAPILDLQIVQGKWGVEFHHNGRVIWGVSARFLGELLEVMGKAL